jgi:hypothetical protein
MPTTESCFVCGREIIQSMKVGQTWRACPWHHDAFQDESDHVLEQKGEDARRSGPEEGSDTHRSIGH